MFRAPRITRYTLEAVLDIACHAHARPVQSKDITERHGIPRRYLEQVMQELVRAGLLQGIRGPRGGYRLARPANEITVGDIARVIGRVSDRDEADQARRAGAPPSCPTIDPLLDDIRRTINERLDAVTLASLCPGDPAPTAPAPPAL
jgi:Rrf2 family iron-sulfur cluster assembly transcriptional regulator